MIGVVITAVSWKPLGTAASAARLTFALARARAASSAPEFRGRLCAPSGGSKAQLWSVDKRLHYADQLLRIARKATGDNAARSTGVAHFLAGDWNLAVASFLSIRQRDARDWNDLAAARICLAFNERRADRWLAALATIDRALAADPFLPEAQFNRAIVLEELGVTVRAQAQWRKYLVLDRDSGWAAIARKRLVAPRTSDTQAWRDATGNLDELPGRKLAELVRAYPEPARRFAEAWYLAVWAERVQAGQAHEAERYLAQIRIIARTLEQDTGESLLADTVRRIDASGVSPPDGLLRGLVAYRDGRRVYVDLGPLAAERKLMEAEVLLREAECPLWELAQVYRAVAIGDENRTSEAQQILRQCVSRARASTVSYKALLATAQYHLALSEAVLGHWSASLAAASDSLALYSSLRERENAVAPHALISEDYDLIGQRERALDEGVTGLRAACAAGDYDRARATLAALCRAELRAGEAERAFSLTSLELEIASLSPEARHEADLFMRRGSALWHLGRLAEATRSMTLARDAAKRAPDAAMRTKLLADVDATEGSFLRRVDPNRALGMLSTAITFQRAATRPIVLPELYLERGRAFMAVNNLAAARDDFEAGLSELERQRSRVSEAELRPGIFDDASELFDEAIALLVRRGADADAVLRQIERGRARAVLEQINAGDDSFAAPALPHVADVQRKLDPGTVLLEYASLPNQLVVIAIKRDRVVMRTIGVTRQALKTEAGAFVDRKGADGGPLYEALIAPLRDELRGVSAVNLVTDDFLQRVPFGALFDRQSRMFLVQQYKIATPPSAGVLLVTLQHLRRMPLLRHPRALVFANPTIPRAEYVDLPSLSASEYEAPKIGRRYVDANVFVGDAATAERFQQLAPRSDFVHFAGHGVINQREPFSSALVCAATAGRRGGLTAHDIAGMSFRSTRVVVLAACSTMAGRNAAIEGVPSLARAFVVAGVPAVVGTLWDIEDGDAAAITLPLHEQLAHGVAPADALRAAQIAAIQQGLPPSQWSAFSLMGSASSSTKGLQLPRYLP